MKYYLHGLIVVSAPDVIFGQNSYPDNYGVCSKFIVFIVLIYFRKQETMLKEHNKVNLYAVITVVSTVRLQVPAL